jgi:hypothetical protein
MKMSTNIANMRKKKGIAATELKDGEKRETKEEKAKREAEEAKMAKIRGTHLDPDFISPTYGVQADRLMWLDFETKMKDLMYNMV